MKLFNRIQVLLVASIAASILTPLAAQKTFELSKMDYPVTPSGVIENVYYDKAIVDPFIWLEKIESSDTKQWMRSQDSLTRSLLQPLEERNKIFSYMQKVNPKNYYNPICIAKGYYYFTRSYKEQENKQTVSICYRQNGLEGIAQELFRDKDHGPNAFFSTNSGSGSSNMKLSPSGRYLAYGIRKGTSLWAEWYIFDTEKEVVLEDKIKGLYHYSANNSITWSSDEKGFYYAAAEKTTDDHPKAQKVYYHQLGSTQKYDQLIFESSKHPKWTFSHQITSNGQILLLSAYDKGYTPKGTFWLLLDSSKNDMLQHGFSPIPMSFLGDNGDQLFFSTRNKAPFGKLLKFKMLDGELKEEGTLIGEKENQNLNNAYFLNGAIVIEYTLDARTLLEVYNQNGQFLYDLPLPYDGWLVSGIKLHPKSDYLLFELQGTADPGSVYTCNIKNREVKLFKRQSENFDASNYETRFVFYKSKDGTQIPLFLMHKKGIKPNGQHPVWLYSYGRNWAAKPWYQIQHRVWLDMGGIYALAHVRGGGEYGQSWQESGLGLNKQNGIDDLIAAGEWLIEKKFTNPNRLVVNGGSASGPLAAAALMQRPDLFGAALLSYGAYDLLRDPEIRPGSLGVHGDPDESKQVFESLYQWSPYHNVKKGVCYPPVLIAHGNLDRGTPTAHSLKLAAKMQQLQTCGAPILLQIAWGRGHTVGGMEERANQLSFLLKALDLALPTAIK